MIINLAFKCCFSWDHFLFVFNKIKIQTFFLFFGWISKLKKELVKFLKFLQIIFWSDQFQRFYVYWIQQTNKQTL